MKIVRSQAMQDLDRRTIEEYGIPGRVLMDRAGAAVADRVRAYLTAVGKTPATVQLFAGRGHNGGDVFAAARHLVAPALKQHVYLAGRREDVRGDALWHLEQMEAVGIPLTMLATDDDVKKLCRDFWAGEVIVDGLLGTGSQGAPRGVIGECVKLIHEQASQSWVLAIDLPTGVDADTGKVTGAAVRADVTVTMGLLKTGLLKADEWVGSLEIADIGFPASLVAEAPADETCEVIHPVDLRSLWPKRPPHAHKGNFGHVLLIGGSRSYPGAIRLAARAALRAGAGLVTILTPASLYEVMAASAPEWMVCGLPETEIGSLSRHALEDWRDRFNDYDAILCGPGMTQHEDTLFWVQALLSQAARPLVLDADALSVLVADAAIIAEAKAPVVITPHPGEFATVFGSDREAVQQDRVGHALVAAERIRQTVVLKGHHTVVAHPGQKAWINLTGNPGMASAGTGDVLAGMLTSLLGQGMTPFDAARTAVYLHGHAGDLAAEAGSQASLIASDLIEYLPAATRSLIYSR